MSDTITTPPRNSDLSQTQQKFSHGKGVDDCIGGAYPDGLYHPTSTAETIKHLGGIDDDAIAHYREDGFLSVTHAFNDQERAEAIEGLLNLIGGRYPGFDQIQFEKHAAERLEDLSIEQKQDAVRKLGWFCDHEPKLRRMADHPKLLAAVSKLMGGAEPRRFQDMALLKPPGGGREKPWHQDKAYFNYPVDTPVVGVWIALDEATLENGCMHLLRGGHKEGPRLHWARRDWQICDTEMLGLEAVAAPLPAGGALLFDGLLPHGTPTNRSGARRRAVQFHYCPADIAETAEAERLEVFGNEGKGVEC